MTRILGIDGGQSGTRLRHSDGREAASHGVSHLEGDTTQALADAVNVAWQRGGFDAVDRVVLGLTTAPADGAEADRLCRLIAHTTGASEVWLADDAVTSHAGALSLGWGVSVVAGTGVACLAMPEAGDARVIGGHGFLLGDEGGAFWIGRRALVGLLRAGEGRASGDAPPGGRLIEAVVRRFGPIAELPARLHSVERPVDSIADFARDVLDACDEADPFAENVIDHAVAELVVLVAAAAHWSAPLESMTPVALGGRLLAEGTTMRHRLEAALEHAHVATRVRSADHSPVEGAVLLGARDDPGRYTSFIHRWRQEVVA